MQSITLAPLEAIVNRALAAYPAEEDRITRGAGIVEAGLVLDHEHGGYRVGERRYHVVGGACNCLDFSLMHAPHGRCKHRWAVSLYRRSLQEECMADVEAPRSLQFYASLGATCGIATVWEDGRILFQAHGTPTSEAIPCTLAEIALSGRKDLVDAALSAN